MGEKHRVMRRYHTLSPDFFGDYQDLGLQATNGRFRVAVLILAWIDLAENPTQKQQTPCETVSGVIPALTSMPLL